ncbi:MAG: DUF5719 family protein [Propionibacteriaceae bacterium]|nr:DUF5719 family protein [Propionibacteriaceae bacterium]
MKRLLIPFLALLFGAGGLWGSSLIPAGSPPQRPLPVSKVKVSKVCAALETGTAKWQVVAASRTGELISSELGDEPTDAPSQLITLSQPPNPIRISAPRDDDFAGITWLAQADGPERGMSTIACSTASTSLWFVGALLTTDASAELNLYNSDSTDAIVDMAIYDANGRVPAPGARGIYVKARSSYSVPLAAMSTAANPIAASAFTIHLQTSQGRIAATLRQHHWDKNAPRSSEWIPATAEPGLNVTLPGIPEGAGTREVVIVNPSNRTARLSVEFLGPEDTSLLPGTEDVEVPAFTTQSFSLTDAIGELPGALRLISRNAEIAATVKVSAGEKVDQGFVAAPSQLGERGFWVLPDTTKTAAVLQVANSGTNEATAILTTSADLKEQSQQVITVAPGTTAIVDLTAAPQTFLTLTTQSAQLQAAVAFTRKVGDLAAVSVLPLDVDDSVSEKFTLSVDPHVGS